MSTHLFDKRIYFRSPGHVYLEHMKRSMGHSNEQEVPVFSTTLNDIKQAVQESAEEKKAAQEEQVRTDQLVEATVAYRSAALQHQAGLLTDWELDLVHQRFLSQVAAFQQTTAQEQHQDHEVIHIPKSIPSVLVVSHLPHFEKEGAV